MNGNFSEKAKRIIALKDFSKKAVEEFVRYLYGYELQQEHLELVKELVIMGGVYFVDSLQTAATSCLSKHLSKENVLDVLSFMRTHKAITAVEICAEFCLNTLNLDTLDNSGQLENYPEILLAFFRKMRFNTNTSYQMETQGVGRGRGRGRGIRAGPTW